MKRSNFLKLVATLVVAPTLMGGGKTIEPYKSGLDCCDIEGDTVLIYTKQAYECAVGDMIVSDMGDIAVIVTISSVDKDKPYVVARTKVKGVYRYKSLNNFQLLKNLINDIAPQS